MKGSRSPTMLPARFLLALALASTAFATKTVEVHNPFGAVAVNIQASLRLKVQGFGENRAARQADTQITTAADRVIVRCAPPDGEPIDLELQVPLGYSVEATTQAGDITVRGIVRRVRLRTTSGGIYLSVPWRATRLTVDADSKPAKVETPASASFTRRMVEVEEDRSIWRMRDRLGEWDSAFGDVRVWSRTPSRVALSEYPISADSPIKFPWQAPAILDSLLRGSLRSAGRPEAVTKTEPAAGGGVALFRTDVRMANFALSVQDQVGRPLDRLDPSDFEVFEDGVQQEVAFAGSEEVPFNLALLLDLSGSTKPDRASMRAAALQLVELARPQDRVAIYALAGGAFHVVSHLTGNRDELKAKIEGLPAVSGASPLYDTIVLAYAEELAKRSGERNALIVISDGIDNQISGQEAPSAVNFKSLVRGAAHFNSLVYPIFLRSGERFGRGWSAKAMTRMARISDAAGGRLFPASSIHDLSPVLPQVATELRSVYSLAYYPSNQDFDGKWRSVQVSVLKPGARVRAREGYFAR